MTLWLCMSSLTHSRSALRSCLVASSAPAPATTAFADFSLRKKNRRPFRRKARSPQVRTHSFIAQPPHLRRLAWVTKASRFRARSPCSAAPSMRFLFIGSRFTLRACLPTFGHPHAAALHFAYCDQLAGELAHPGVRPCWAHTEKGPQRRRAVGLFDERPDRLRSPTQKGMSSSMSSKLLAGRAAGAGAGRAAGAGARGALAGGRE